MVTKAIKPGLEEKGYSVEVREFSDYIQPNNALAQEIWMRIYSSIKCTWKLSPNSIT